MKEVVYCYTLNGDSVCLSLFSLFPSPFSPLPQPLSPQKPELSSFHVFLH